MSGLQRLYPHWIDGSQIHHNFCISLISIYRVIQTTLHPNCIVHLRCTLWCSHDIKTLQLTSYIDPDFPTIRSGDHNRVGNKGFTVHLLRQMSLVSVSWESPLCQLFFLSAFKRLVWVSHVLNHQRACTVTRNCAAYICNNKLKQIARLYLYLHVVRDSILYWYSRSRFENVYTGLKKTGSDNNTTKCKQNGLRNSPRTWNRTEKDSYVKSKLDSIFVLW